MKQNEYVSPDMEIVEMAIENYILAGSDEDWGDPEAGGSTGGL